MLVAANPARRKQWLMAQRRFGRYLRPIVPGGSTGGFGRCTGHSP
jgi:hypothetical protein